MSDTSVAYHWEDEALCKGYHPDLWFPPILPEDREQELEAYYDIAKMVCEHCPVSGQCLEEGLKSDAENGVAGVWGGTSPQDRLEGTHTPPSRHMSANDIPKVIPMYSETRLGLEEVQRSVRRRSWWHS